MTVGELKQALEQYPDDMNVKVALCRQIGDLGEVRHGVDMDSNVVSVWLMGREE